MNKYTVFYKLGSIHDKIHVEAHDKKQAAEIAGIQARYSHNSRANIKIILILAEGESNPYDELAKKFLVKKA
jgi:hypothetical protein